MTLPWNTIALEIVLGTWALFLLALKLFIPQNKEHHAWWVALAGIPVGWYALAHASNGTVQAFQHMFVLDAASVYFKGLFLLVGFLVIVWTRQYYRFDKLNSWALYVLILIALLGAMVVSSANDLVLLFIGLELVTFSLYIMVAYLKTDRSSVEAGMKYLIMGSASSGLLIYGIALLYGFAGTTRLPEIQAALNSGSLPITAFAGFLLLLAGIGFKIGLVPFQWWIPDVYEGAPTPTVALLSIGSKLVGVAALMRVLGGMMSPISSWWSTPLAVLAVITLTYGNLAALTQTNIKRLLGYSSISHAGYLILGLALAKPYGVEAVAYYALAYVISGAVVFGVVILASRSLGSDEVSAYDGLATRSPLLAGCMFLGLLSLAGVPPTAGFFGKLLILLAAVRADWIVFALIGAVNVAISLFYYLNVVKRMYAYETHQDTPVALSKSARLLLLLLSLAILFIGLFQAPTIDLIARYFGSS